MRAPVRAFLRGSAAVVAIASWAGCGTGTTSADLPPEASCFNGIDDNGDGLVDCGDPSCLPGAECVAAADGFELGTRVEAAEACPADFPDADLVVGQGLQASAACGACGCSAPDAQCYAPMTTYGSNDCTGPYIHAASVTTAAICVGAEASTTGMRSIHFGSVRLYPGPCQPTNPIAATTWTERTRFCGTIHLGGGCATGQVCAPKATSRCALAGGSRACPAGYAKANQASWYAGVDDQRVCPCSCDAATGLSCAGFTMELLGSMCADPYATVTQDTCEVREFGSHMAARALGGPGGSCAPHGPGAMTGTALPSGEQTLCCLP